MGVLSSQNKIEIRRCPKLTTRDTTKFLEKNYIFFSEGIVSYLRKLIMLRSVLVLVEITEV